LRRNSKICAKRNELFAHHFPRTSQEDDPSLSELKSALPFCDYPNETQKVNDQQVYAILLKMLDRWNTHYIEGHLEAYWKSPELLVIVGSEQFNSWQQLHDFKMFF
jgi:hypothetical protein